MDGLRLRAGTLKDYGNLQEFHYLRNRPATATRVLVLEDRRPTVAGRFFKYRAGDGGDPRLRCASSRLGEARGLEPVGFGDRHESEVAAVLVESLPALSCVLRDEALGGRYRGWPDRGMGARLLNAEVRCISRVVVHPQWRGLGLAVRLVREALRTMTTQYTEALAAMGRVHPFFELAGMRAYRRWPLAKDQRLLDALRWAGVEPWELASGERMKGLMGSGAGEDPDDSLNSSSGLGGLRGAVLRRELGRWAGRGLALGEQLALARDRLLCEPIYYLKTRDDETAGGGEGGDG